MKDGTIIRVRVVGGYGAPAPFGSLFGLNGHSPFPFGSFQPVMGRVIVLRTPFTLFDSDEGEYDEETLFPEGTPEELKCPADGRLCPLKYEQWKQQQ